MSKKSNIEIGNLVRVRRRIGDPRNLMGVVGRIGLVIGCAAHLPWMKNRKSFFVLIGEEPKWVFIPCELEKV